MPGPAIDQKPQQINLRSTYSSKPEYSLSPIFTGGRIAVSSNPISLDSEDQSSAQLLFTTFADSVVISSLQDGRKIHTIQLEDAVTNLSVSNDGKYLFVASRALLAKVYSLENSTGASQEGEAQTSTPEAGNANADNAEDADNEDDAENALDITTASEYEPTLLHTIRLPSPCLVSTFDETNSLLATGHADGSIRVYDAEGGYITHAYRQGMGSGVVSCLRFWAPSDETSTTSTSMPDKKKRKNKKKQHLFLIASSLDASWRIYNLMDKSLSLTLTSHHTSVIRAIDISPCKSYLLTAGRDQLVHIFNIKSLLSACVSSDSNGVSPVTTIPVFESVEAAGFINKKQAPCLPDTTQEVPIFYTVGTLAYPRIFMASSQTPILAPPNQHIPATSKDDSSNLAIMDALVLPSLNRLCTVTSEQNIVFWDLGDSLKRREMIVGYMEEVVDMSILPTSFKNEDKLDQTSLVLVTPTPTPIIASLSSPYATPLSSEHGHTDTVLCCDILPNGFILTAGRDRAARIWACNADNEWTVVSVAKGHTESVGTIVASRRRVNSAGKTGKDVDGFFVTGSEDRTLKVWDVPVLSADSSEEPKELKSKVTVSPHAAAINAISLSPPGHLIATASQDKTIKILSLPTCSEQMVLTGHKRGVWSCTFSPVDRVLASSSGDGTVRVWSLRDGSCLRTFEGHEGSVLGVSWMNMGTQLVSWGSDTTVRVWGIRSGVCVHTIDEGHEDKIWKCGVVADGVGIVSASADGVVNAWKDVTVEEQMRVEKEREELVEKEQKLENLWRVGRYGDAVRLAVSLNRPATLAKLLNDAIGNPKNKEDVAQVLANLKGRLLERVLDYLKDWNTRGKTAVVAQWVLNCIWKSRDMNEMLAIKGIKEILIALIPYTTRHMSHTDNLITDSYTIDWILGVMDVLAGMDAMDLDEDMLQDENMDSVLGFPTNFDEAEEEQKMWKSYADLGTSVFSSVVNTSVQILGDDVDPETCDAEPVPIDDDDQE